MTGPGFLEFFILEASDYVEQLDGLLLSGGSRGPDADALQRIARALRGTATMAKIAAFAELAAGIERIGRSMHDGVLRWDPTLDGALVAAIDDLKTLLHSARAWSPADDRRAQTRSTELARFAPPAAKPATPSVATAGALASGASTFLATEAANIAAGLELLTTRAGDADTAANVLRRIRALRGVAGVKEVLPLADVLESTENAGRSLEGHVDLPTEARRLLEASAGYLRMLATALRDGADINAPSPARDAFETARDAWSVRDADRERVVPIAELFYPDGTPGIVEKAPHPPTTASERFRLELVSHGEHLRQVVDAARTAKDPASRGRAQRELRHALKALEAAAESFAETEVVDFVRAHAHAAETIDYLGLTALDDLAAVLAEPGAQGQRLRSRLQELAGGRDLATAIGVGFGRETPHATPAISAPATPRLPVGPAAAAPTPRASSQVPPRPVEVERVAPPSAPPPAPPPPAPRAEPPRATVQRTSGSLSEKLDRSAAALIDSSIAAIETLSAKPLLPHTLLDEEQGQVVPIESLLYRGRAALDRAVEIRDQLRHGSSPPDPDALEELYDLLELALAE